MRATYDPYRPPLDGPFRRVRNGPFQMRRPGVGAIRSGWTPDSRKVTNVPYIKGSLSNGSFIQRSEWTPSASVHARLHPACSHAVASTLDVLQTDENSFYGLLSPKLAQMRNKLSPLSLKTKDKSQSQLHHARPQIIAM